MSRKVEALCNAMERNHTLEHDPVNKNGIYNLRVLLNLLQLEKLDKKESFIKICYLPFIYYEK